MELLQQFPQSKVIMTDNEPSFTRPNLNHLHRGVELRCITQTQDIVLQKDKLKGHTRR